MYLSIQKQLNFNWDNQDNSPELSLEKATETAPLVIGKMFENYPSMQEFYYDAVSKLPINKKDQSIDYSWLYGKWMKNTPEIEDQNVLQNFDRQY